MSDVYEDIREEHKRQDEEWGGPQHDDDHHRGDWILMISKFVGKAANAAMIRSSYFIWRGLLIQIAALCVAAVESADRKFTTNA